METITYAQVVIRIHDPDYDPILADVVHVADGVRFVRLPEYTISSEGGIVLSKKNDKIAGKILKNSTWTHTKTGKQYKQHQLTITDADGISKCMTIKTHIIVFDSFFGYFKYKKGHDVDHIDGNSLNSDLTNLRMVSKETNRRNQRSAQKNRKDPTLPLNIFYHPARSTSKPYFLARKYLTRSAKKTTSKCFTIHHYPSHDAALQAAIEWKEKDAIDWSTAEVEEPPEEEEDAADEDVADEDDDVDEDEDEPRSPKRQKTITFFFKVVVPVA